MEFAQFRDYYYREKFEVHDVTEEFKRNVCADVGSVFSRGHSVLTDLMRALLVSPSAAALVSRLEKVLVPTLLSQIK